MFDLVWLIISLSLLISFGLTSAMSSIRYAASPLESEYCFSTLYGDDLFEHTRLVDMNVADPNVPSLFSRDRAQIDFMEIDRPDCRTEVVIPDEGR